MVHIRCRQYYGLKVQLPQLTKIQQGQLDGNMVLAEEVHVVIKAFGLNAPEAEKWLLLYNKLLCQLGQKGRRKGEVQGSNVPARDELVEEGTCATEFLQVRDVQEHQHSLKDC